MLGRVDFIFYTYICACELSEALQTRKVQIISTLTLFSCCLRYTKSKHNTHFVILFFVILLFYILNINPFFKFLKNMIFMLCSFINRYHLRYKSKA